MIVTVKSFQTPKSGNFPDEYEDALQPEKEGDYTHPAFYAAMADGASEGYLSGEWARLLVKEYCDALGALEGASKDENHDLIALVQSSCIKWATFLKDYVDRRQLDNRPVQWYEEPGLENGAFSTLLGLAILNGPGPNEQTWSASAVGDTCLFQIRQNQLIDCFPIQKAGLFNSWPALISSNPARNLKISENIQQTGGNWQVEDCFLLMSDALSAWFLKEYEAERRPWIILRTIVSGEKDDFPLWIEELRGKNEIKNDDVTLMSLFISEC